MKKHNTTKRQKGFFDAGISVAILALSGLFAYAVAPDDNAEIAVQEAQVEVVANLETDNRVIDLH